MLFDVTHLTDYRYSEPVSEAYVEARLTPPHRKEQEILSHRIEFSPGAGTSDYVDYFGNTATFYSMTLRHERLTVTNRMTVRTSPHHPAE
ncbi:MAG: transglutaminase N-terminal domain-containing protein, partial [Verrucomicrobiota bacterium]